MKNNEKEILNIIRYLPVVLILLVSFLLTSFLYSEISNRFDKEVKELETKYISLNKELIKFEIEKIKSRILEEKKRKISVLRKELRNQVTNAYNIAYSIYKNNPEKSK
jgi:biopolymer transport protein ExbD